MSEEEIKKYSNENFADEIAKGKTFVDFYAEWCGPCRMLNPIIKELAVEMKGSVVFGKVDIDVAEKIAEQFHITSVPTMILFQDGQEIGRIEGLRDKKAIQEFIQNIGA